MKKLFTLLTLAVLVNFNAMAQEPTEIFQKYLDASKFSTFEGMEDGESSIFEVEMDMMGQIIMPYKVIAKYPEKYRIDMEMQGTNVLIIVDGDIAYVTANGMTEVIEDPAAIAQLVPMTDFLQDMKYDMAQFSDLTYVGAEGKGKKACDIIEGVITETGVKTRLYFNKANSLLVKSESIFTLEDGSEQSAVVELSKYTEYLDGELILPSVVTIETPEGDIVMTIKTFEGGYPTAPWMFAAPKM